MCCAGCWKVVFVMNKLYMLQKSTNSSPIAFLCSPEYLLTLLSCFYSNITCYKYDV